MTKGSDSREFFEIFKTPLKVGEDEKKEVKHITESTDVSSKQKLPTTEDKPVTKPGASSQDALGWIKSTRLEDTAFKGKTETPKAPQSVYTQPKTERIQRKDELVLRQETLIIGVIAVTFLTIACFFVGYKVGYNKGTTGQATEEWLETIEPQDAKKTSFGQSKPSEGTQKAVTKAASIKTEKQAEKITPIIKDKWTLRVVSYKNTKENIEKAKEIAGKLQDALGYSTFVVNTGKELFICIGEFESNDDADLIAAQKAVAGFKYENRTQFEGCYPVRMR
jgi:hypothetical protein